LSQQTVSKRKSGQLVYSVLYDLSEYKHIISADKYRLLYDELKYGKWQWNAPDPAAEDILALVHTKRYLRDFLGARLTDTTMQAEVPIDANIVEAVRAATQGTVLAAELALKHGVASNLSGGFHHAFADHAEGFCFLNDIVIAIRTLRQKKPGLRVTVIDLDVHQGNGTAFLLKDDADSYTFSMHERDNYPVKQQSNHDVELETNIGDVEYNKLLRDNLLIAAEVFSPDLIFYIAGADVYKDDALGGLNLSFEGVAERDRQVRDFLPHVPLVVLPAGGYARNIADTVKLHAQTIKILHGKES
jgi:acetoin utilization deacetylase AcuC-like enzyme